MIKGVQEKSNAKRSYRNDYMRGSTVGTVSEVRMETKLRKRLGRVRPRWSFSV